MPWIRHRLRDADVWAKVDASGALLQDAGGRAEIVYKPAAGAKVYRASVRNLTAPSGAAVEFEAGEAAPPSKAAAAAGKPASAREAAIPADAIQVWTDGGCRPNPGPGGLGVVIVDQGVQRELAEYLGPSTNNIAELSAILRGLQEVPDKQRTVVVYTDSTYSIGSLTKPWKPKKNIELIADIKRLTSQFADLRFVKVAAHSGIPLNERVDHLVGVAITRRANYASR